MQTYPEHEKLAKVSKESQAQGEFLEWLKGQQIEMRRHHETRYICDVCGEIEYIEIGWETKGLGEMAYHRGECEENVDVLNEGYYRVRETTEELLALYHGIDLKKVQEEKDHMLETMRS